MPSRRDAWLALASGHTRHWWARQPGHDYVPPAFALLSEPEWRLMLAWFAATGDWPGEMNVPALGVLQGLIEGGGISRVVELGRYHGYGTLLMGWMLRRMGATDGLVSFDVSPEPTAVAREWIAKAHLEPYCRLELLDSRDPAGPELVWRHFGEQQAQLIYLDTSHARGQTVDELRIWYDHLAPGGLLLLHDSSAFAAQWDATGQGGVRAGLHEWLATLPSWPTRPTFANLSGDVETWGEGVYADPNGLGLLVKPVHP